MLEKVKQVASKKHVRTIAHVARGSAISLTGACSITIGYVFAVCGVVACCNDHQVKKDYVITSVLGGGLMYGGYRMLNEGIEEIGNAIVDACTTEPKKPGIVPSNM